MVDQIVHLRERLRSTTRQAARWPGRVVEVLGRLVSRRGAPAHLRCDNGPELVARGAEADRRAGHRHRVQRSRQAVAEWRQPELQRHVRRPVPQPRMVRLAGQGQGRHRDLGSALHHGAAAFQPRLFDASGLRRDARTTDRGACNGNGPGRGACSGLRARPVASPYRKGHPKPAAEGPVSYQPWPEETRQVRRTLRPWPMPRMNRPPLPQNPPPAPDSPIPRPSRRTPPTAPAPRARSPRQRNSAIPTRRCCSRRQPHRLGELHVAGPAAPLQGGQQATVETVQIDRHRILADFRGVAAGSCKKQGAIPRTRHEISD